MARATRIALDLALVSLNKIRPAVYKVWSLTKDSISSTKIKPLVCNSVVRLIETKLEEAAAILVSQITDKRDKQLAGEKAYLEKELENVKKKLENPTSKALRPTLATSWQYLKTEAVPPMTTNFFHGPVGENIEKAVSKAADQLINGLQQTIDQIDAEEKRKIREKEEALKAEQEKAKAIALKRQKEAEKLLAEAAQKAQATKTEEAKKETKAEAKTSTKEGKQLEPTAKKESKQGDKKGAPPKK